MLFYEPKKEFIDSSKILIPVNTAPKCSLIHSNVPKEYHQVFRNFEVFLDKVNEIKYQLANNPKFGDHFTGKFTEGKMDGLGEFKYPNGEFYKGKFEHNKRSGQGICIYPDGTAYFGEWKNDLFNGIGIYLSADGNMIDGNWHGTVENPF